MANKKQIEKRPFHPADHWVPESATSTSHRYPDVFVEASPGKLTSWSQTAPHSVELECENGFRLLLEAYTETIWRVRYSDTEFSPMHSYAIDPALSSGSGQPQLKVTESDTEVQINSQKAGVRVAKADLRLSWMDQDRVILRDKTPYIQRSTYLEGTNHLRLHFETTPDEAFFGLGDKSWHLNLKGRHFQNWNSDAFGYSRTSDPLYRSIPFYYGLRDGQAYGVFFHNTWRTHFDFDSHREGSIRLWAEGGEMDYFFIYGPELDQVAQSYHWLTGRPELPPLWALGFHQCRWSYYPEERVRALAQDFREKQIPCDAIYLDIDYMDGYRCFTWNEEHFPKPAAMIKDLADDGFQTVVMIDPGIRVDKDYHVYQSGLENDFFCRRTSGELMEGPVWPPLCVWPDYTRQDVRQWWGELYTELYKDHHVSGFWNDMNEPAVFKVNSLSFPDGVMHENDGHPSDHRQAHNIYGQQMSRATYEGLKQLKPGKRPFVLTRATFSGGQRFAAVWTGDNIASWEHLRIANHQCQRLSISGFSLVGTDIGGFKDQPAPELLIRWLQLGVFHPVFRVHSMGNNIDGAAEADAESIKEAEAKFRLDQEPWVFGEPYTSQARRAIEFRYRLLPYLYTTMYEHSQTGLPVIRSLSFVDQSDPRTVQRENEFMLGRHLLANPVMKQGVKTQGTYLPAGGWFDFYSGRSFEGRRVVRQRINADSIPLFVRAGAVIPFYPVQQYTNELELETVELRAYFGEEQVSSSFYIDAGEGYAYEKEDYLLYSFQTSGSTTAFAITSSRKGKFQASYAVFEVKCFGLPFEPKEVYIDGVAIQILDFEDGAAVVMVPADFNTLELRG